MTQDERLVVAPEVSEERRDDRRAFFAAAAGALAIGTGAFLFADPLSAQTLVDADVLNFALNIEYLQANFYGYASAGAGLATADTQSGAATPVAGGTVIPGAKVTFADPIVAAYANEMAAVNLNQVRFLRTSLATSAVAQPAIDLGNAATSAFSEMAQNAGLVAQGAPFDPYASDTNFLLAAFFLQDVAVSAYQGMFALLSSKTYQEAFGGLMATEAHHAALVRTTLYQKSVATPALLDQVDLISNYRDSIDGGTDDDQGIRPVSSGNGLVANIAPVDSNANTFPRTSGTVLNELFLTRTSTTKGGFFPGGINGNITTSAAS
ncbi:ferritin-like domain-containing protein [Sphingomonas sp. TX0543]|uniref:ferritin-like domain-containing protein n=1 Tax=Sphingomonas sp. TX0543 TaxID=3399682 RepID=UPI003AFB6C18